MCVLISCMLFSGTNVTNINQTLSVSSVDLQDGRGVAITVSFKVLTQSTFTHIHS